MQVIFLQDVPGTARKHEVKNVSDGYARNFLIPRKLAAIATEAAKKNIESLKGKKEEEDAKKRDEKLALIAALDGKKITITEKANEEGHLFAGITRERVAKELHGVIGKPVDAHIFHLAHPIKAVGMHEVIAQAEGKEAKIHVEVAAS